MAKSTALAECPPLPSGPLDLDVLLSACAAGKTAEEAIAAATANNPKPEEVAEAARAVEAESAPTPAKNEADDAAPTQE